MLIDPRVKDPIILEDVFNDTFKSRYFKLLIGQEFVGFLGHQRPSSHSLLHGSFVLSNFTTRW